MTSKMCRASPAELSDSKDSGVKSWVSLSMMDREFWSDGLNGGAVLSGKAEVVYEFSSSKMFQPLVKYTFSRLPHLDQSPIQHADSR